MGYFKDTVFGVTWVGVLRASNRLIVFAKLAILARLLTPAQFGIFAVATLALAFLEIATETGINVFLIQQKADLKKYINTAWVVAILRGGLIWVILLSVSPLVAAFFRSPKALPILYLLSFVPLVRGMINPAVVTFQKELNFAKEFYYRLAIYSMDAVCAVAIAIKTRSAESLVWGMLIAAIFEVIISHLVINPKPKLKFDIKKVKNIIHRGKWITLAGIFNYLFENTDNAVVGRILDTVSLGFYQMAYKISSIPLTEVADVIKKVTFPVYVKIADDKLRLEKAFKKSMVATLALVLPMGIVLFVFPAQIVKLLLGENWLVIVPVIKVMSFFGVIRALVASFYSLFLAIKKQEYVTAVALAGIVGLAITIIPFVKMWGLVGAGYSALIGTAFTVPVAIYYAYSYFRS